MTKYPKLLRTISLLLAPVAGATAFAVPAQAYALPTLCPASAFCMFKGAYRQGAVAFYRARNIGGGVRVAASFAGQASSILNLTGSTVRVFATPDCRGSSLLYEDIRPNGYVPNLARLGLDNKVRSLRIVGVGWGSC